MREAVLVASVRTPVGRAFKGTLRASRPDELAAVVIQGALERVPQLDPQEIEDVILGCAMPEAEQGMNVARIAAHGVLRWETFSDRRVREQRPIVAAAGADADASGSFDIDDADDMDDEAEDDEE